MILEAAVLYVKPGQESGFENDFKTAGRYISSVPGYLRDDLQKCLEQANKYLLLVEWEKLEDHMQGFRQSPAYQSWKSLLHHYYAPFPVVEHFETVLLQEF